MYLSSSLFADTIPIGSSKTTVVNIVNPSIENCPEPRDPAPSTSQPETRTKKSTGFTLTSSMIAHSVPAHKGNCKRSLSNLKKRRGAQAEKPDNKRQKTSATTQRKLANVVYRAINVLDTSSLIHGLANIRHLTQAYRDILFQGTCKYLNGWDLGSEVYGKAKKDQSKLDGVAEDFQISTRAFLAIDCLRGGEVAHRERHDWESAFYVLVWILTRFEDGKRLKGTEDLKRWTDPEDTINRAAKVTFRNCIYLRPKVRTHEALYEHWIDPLSIVFDNGLLAHNSFIRSKASPSLFNFETMGGEVTYEKLWLILKDVLPEASP